MIHLNIKNKSIFVLGLLLVAPLNVNAELDSLVNAMEISPCPVDTLMQDSVLGIALESTQPKKSSWIKNWWQQFAYGQVDRTFEKPIDLSWVVAPTYADDGGFGIGGGGSALFRINRSDSILPPSNALLTANITLKAFFSFYFKSNLYIDRKNQLELYADLQSRNRYFWGINYHQCDSNYNLEHRYRYTSSNVYVRYIHKVVPNFYLGSVLQLNLRKVKNWDFLNDSLQRDFLIDEKGRQDDYHAYLGLGAIIKYDSRDFIPNPSRGFHVMLQETFYKRLVGNRADCAWNTIFNINSYVKLWKGGLLALDFYANCYDRSVPWTMRQEISSDYARMRGYYIGRYFDNNQMSATIELRQHIWKRIGLAAWAGCGNFFRDWDDYEWERWLKLPSVGLGFRFEFKKNVNARIDFGVGRDGPTFYTAFVFDMGEAF